MPGPYVRCKECKLDFDSQGEMNAHLVQSEKHKACSICFSIFRTDGALREHIRQYHPAEQDIACKCGQRFNRAAGLIAHITEGLCSGVKSEFEIGRLRGKLLNAALASHENSNWNNNTAPDKTDSHNFNLPAVSQASEDIKCQSDDDLLIFDPPCSNGLSSDNPWSTEQNYNPASAVSVKREGKSKQVSLDLLSHPVGAPLVSTAAVLKPVIESAPKYDNINPALKPNVKLAKNSDMWVQAKKSKDVDEWTREELLAEIERQHKETIERNKRNPHHPTCPDFNIQNYWIDILMAYKCPYPRCMKTKPRREAFLQHLTSPAHQDDKITCVVCLRVYSSPTAYMQHFESQGKRCRAREHGNGILNLTTGGVISIVGEHPDQTNKYGAWIDDTNNGIRAADEALKKFKKEQKLHPNYQEAQAKKDRAESASWEQNTSEDHSKTQAKPNLPQLTWAQKVRGDCEKAQVKHGRAQLASWGQKSFDDSQKTAQVKQSQAQQSSWW